MLGSTKTPMAITRQHVTWFFKVALLL